MERVWIIVLYENILFLINCILIENWETSHGIGIINFKTREIRLLKENVRTFIFENFYIFCDLRNRGTGNS